MFNHSCEVQAVADSDPVQRPRQAETPTIRVREPADDPAIAATITAAFAGASETALVNALRHDGDMILELVAQMDDQLIGHIAYSRLSVTSASASLNATALAPLSVFPSHQHRGVGSALIKASITHLKRQGVELAVVLGHPNYYVRFGFSNLLARLLDAPYAGDAFMALELAPGSVRSQRWTVTYPLAFSR